MHKNNRCYQHEYKNTSNFYKREIKQMEQPQF